MCHAEHFGGLAAWWSRNQSIIWGIWTTSVPNRLGDTAIVQKDKCLNVLENSRSLKAA